MDTPHSPCLPTGPVSILIAIQASVTCDGKAYPLNSDLEFETTLVGVSARGGLVPLPVDDFFDWTSTFNGTSGGVNIPIPDDPGLADPGSGYGGVTILDVIGVPVSTPEPGTLTLLGSAFLALLVWRRGRCVSKVVAIGLLAFAGSGVSTRASAQDFDGSYRGLQRYIDSPDETRSPYGHTSRCSVPSSKPPTLTIQNGVATMPWCHGSCVMTGRVDKIGHLEMRHPDSKDIIIVQLYPKGTYEFGARAQIDGYSCRQVLTWAKR